MSLTCQQCGTDLSQSSSGLCPKCLLQAGKTPQQQTAPTMDFAKPAKSLPKPDKINQLFPELEILDVIGHGGMGVVYKARQSNLGRIVAVKILMTELMDDPKFAERFTREARAMAMMNHPNIISIYDFGQRGEYHYLVMEYVDGLNLRQLISTTQFTPSEALELIPQLCDALQYAHDRGIVHRDIKPENVLLSQDGQVKIADFGLAKLTGGTSTSHLTQTQQVMGTLNYMAPEQMERPTEVDHRADIYSLGVVIYELLTGELPIGRFAPPSKKVKVDGRLDDVVMRALEKEPNLRFQKVSEFKTGIQSFEQVRAPIRLKALAAPESDQGRRLVQFFAFTTATSLCVFGVLFIIMSGLDIEFISETLARVIGFSLLAVGALMFAVTGIFLSVFKSDDVVQAEQKKKEEEEANYTTTQKIMHSIGVTCFFASGFAFVAGSGSLDLLDKPESKALGIGLGMLGALLFAISGNFGKSKAEKDS